MRKGLSLLPRQIRHNLIRSQISLEIEMPGEIELKLARSKEELEAAFALLHDSYVNAGFMTPHPSGLRVTKYHALPSTSTLIATWKGKVVGTVSVIRNSPMGFPLETIFDTSRFKSKGTRIAEISALAVHQDFRGNRGRILFPMLKFLYHYCVDYFGVDYKLIAVNPLHADFYEALLFFKPIQEGIVKGYQFASGAPAVGRYLDLKLAYDLFAAAYTGKEPTKDLFHYFVKKDEPQLKFPDRTYFKISDPIMTPELLDYFFNQRTQLFSTFSESEKSILHSFYSQEKYVGVLPTLTHAQLRRVTPKRFDVQCRAKIDDQVLGVVKNVSEKGLCLVLPRGAKVNSTVTLRIAIGEFEVASLKASVKWTTDDGKVGMMISHACTQWKEFLSYLEMDLNQTS